MAERSEGTVMHTSWQEHQIERQQSMGEAERDVYAVKFAAARLAMTVGQQIFDARTAAGLSQRALAKRMGTSQAAIDRLESGGTAATLTTLQKVASALGLVVGVVFHPAA